MRKWMYLLPVTAVAAAIFVSAATMSVRAQKTEDQTISDRIYIGEVNVGGMTADEAMQAVEDYVADLAEEEITLTAGDNSITATVEELGLSCSDEEELVNDAVDFGKHGNLIARYKAKKDLEHEDKVFPLVLKVDQEKTETLLEERRDELDHEPVDFGLTRENGEFSIIEGKTGVEIKVSECAQTIDAYFAEGWQEQASIELPSEVAQPKGSAEELAKVKDVLGTFNTDFSSSSAGRAKNVSVAASKINGSLLYPGEEFSVYDAIAPMDAENGYALAGSYENGTTVQTYGGGVCQVSTTLYNAVIRAELEITERYAHSMIVTYVKPSCDAAIAGTSKNLRFKNTTDAPIYIEGYTSGRTLYFTVYGQETRDPNREVIFESETTSTTEPGVEFKATSAAVGTVTKVQSSHVGKKAKLWKIIKVNGVEQSREVFNESTYKASPTIYEVGTSSGSEDAVAAMKAAIASNDLSTVKAAAAEWKDAEKREQEEKEKQEQEEQQKQEQQEQEQQKQQEQQQQSGEGAADANGQ